MPNGKKKKGHKMATHKRKKRLRKKHEKRMKGVCMLIPLRIAAHPFELKREPSRKSKKQNDK